MRQVFLKSAYDLGWGSSDYRVGLGGQGETAYAVTYGTSNAKVVVPLAGTFTNLAVYSPLGLHPDYTFTLMVNGVASALTCALTSSEVLAKDNTHSVAVVAGDDISLRVNVSPFGAGLGYAVCLSIEFEGAEQFYGITPLWGAQTAATYNTGGALGNGIQQVVSSPATLSSTYSICSTAGTITGIGMKALSTSIGGSWTAYITKNQVLQNGAGGTVNTACTLTDGTAYTSNTFSLAIAVGDHVEFALLRNTTNSIFDNAIAISCKFNPTDALSFMCCGGSNNSNANTIEYRWMQSKQLNTNEDIAKCPIGPRGIVVNGLRVESDVQTVGGIVFTIRQNGVDTAATVTVPLLGSSAAISGLTIPFVDGDYIDLKSNPTSGSFTGNGLYWGLSMQAAASIPEISGLYYVSPSKAERHDSYYNDVENKIPDPTVKTALIGE